MVASATGGGVSSLAGTANQITASASTGAVTLSVPSNAQLSVAKATNLTSNGFVKTSGGDGTLGVSTAVTLAELPAADKVRKCTIIVGDPGAASPVLANDNDTPVACTNDYGADWTITTVACYADAGTPTVTPILTGGSATSILTGALTCGTASWAAGTVQGTAPVVHSFSGTGATCSSTPCSIDVNITSAGGAAKYVVVKITGTL